MIDRDDEDVDLARRKLLRKAIYEAPAILGVVALSWASAPPGPSCGPTRCHPNGGACGPDNCSPEIACNPDCMPHNK